MSNVHYALIMLIAGTGIPVLAALNSALGREIGSPAFATVILFAVAFCAALIAAVIIAPNVPSQVLAAPKYLFLAGLPVAFYVLSVTYIAPHFGIGNAVFFVLLGQLLSAAVIDHYGLFGAAQTPLSATRLAGICVMGLGVFLTQFAIKSQG